MRTHHANVDGVDVVFYPCNQEGATTRKKEKKKGREQVEAAPFDVHDIGVKWQSK